MQNYVRLPLNFDPVPLAAEVASIAAEDWVPHFNTGYYEGEWRVAALRSVGGRAGQIFPDHTKTNEFADTPLLAQCPQMQAVLAAFACPFTAVRLLKLTPGTRIREHCDHNLGYEDGEVRLHLPILSNSAVEFVLAGEVVPLQPGETWYLNFNLPHRVANLGTTDRVHLVLDCVLNPWLDELLTQA